MLRSDDTYVFGDFRLDLAEKVLLRDGKAVPVTPKVFETLQLFVENAGHLIEKDELMQKLWQDRFVEESNLTFNIKMLRKALGDNASKPKFIETVQRRGYRFIAPTRLVEKDEKGGPSSAAPTQQTHRPTSIPTVPKTGAVVALAHWKPEAKAKTPDDSNTPIAKPELLLVSPAVRSNPKKLVLPIAAVLVLCAIGLSYYFLYADEGEAIDSIAVLPFLNTNGDTGNEYLSEALSDSIISNLSLLPKLKVNSLNSVLRYKGKEPDPKAVGRELGVRAVLVGRLVQHGDRVTISAELIDVRDDRRLWGDQYTRKLSDMLIVPGEIAQEISDGLRMRLTGEERMLLTTRHTENNDAYLAYSLGKFFGRQFTKEGFEKAIESFERATQIDPNYALAYTAIANTYQFMMSRGFLRPSEYVQKVELAALRALQIDDSLAEAHASLGSYQLINFDWEGAQKEVKRALELDPKSAYAHSVYAHYLLGIGRTDESIAFILRSQELEPSSGRGEEAFFYYMARQYDQAIALYLKNIEKNPNNVQARILLGEAYVVNGTPVEGVKAIEEGVARDLTLSKSAERWDRYPLLAYAYAAAGRRRDARKILDDQLKLAEERYVSPYNFAIIHTALGDKDRAFELLAECIEQRVMIIYHLKTRPIFDPLRSDPRYVELLSKMNLTP